MSLQTVPRVEKETLLNQKAHVFWFYGLSGSGKSTLAHALERKLHEQGLKVAVLDGDNLRSGLNADLGFSDLGREENIRRAAEVAKLFVSNGVVVLASFITPRRAFRDRVRDILGEDVHFIYTEASYATCARRDVKGLYAKAKKGEVRHFTGSDSDFEPPLGGAGDWVIDTDQAEETEVLEEVLGWIEPVVRPA